MSYPKSILTVLQPAASYALITRANVKTELGLTDQSKDTQIDGFIDQVSTDIASHCNRVFALETVRERFFPPRDHWPQEVIGGFDALQLRRWPLVPAVLNAQIAPPAPPVFSTSTGGSLPDRTYYVTTSYVSTAGETGVSAEISLAIAAGQLLQVASPPQDNANEATGWNIYVALIPGGGLRQNATLLGLGTPFIEPATGLAAGVSMQSPTVIETGKTLVRDVDYLADFDLGQLTRLGHDGYPRRWMLPVTVEYQAGYQLPTKLPFDVQRAAIELTKKLYFAANRDPMLRQENVEGAWSATYWFGAGPGSSGSLPPDVAGRLTNYRVPVVG
jgi:hypothetical protein